MNQKIRVFELAKDLKLTSKELLGELKKMKIDAKSHMSVLEDETVAYIKRHWGEDIIEEEYQAPISPEASETGAAPALSGPAETAAGEENAAGFGIPYEIHDHAREATRAVEIPQESEEVIQARNEALKALEEQLNAPKAPAKKIPEEKPAVVEAKPAVAAVKELKAIKIPESASVSEIAQAMEIKPADLIKKLISMGVFATINQRVDRETVEILMAEFGFAPEFQELYGEEMITEQSDEKPENKRLRPPVVTIMGHVNHGKTSLLDAIRLTNVTGGEAGGITQHIGAYQVELEKGMVTFLDTPGHEAFTALRARGAQITDVVVLVVAADDGIQPQTVEAINHARAANVPIIVAINKIDKPGAAPERIKQELTQYNLVAEEWGGKTIFIEISAKKRIGLEKLLEMLLLEAEMLELKADPTVLAKGTTIEAKLDRGRGPVATILVQKGTLQIGDSFVIGNQYGRVRALNTDRGQAVKKVGPGTPVELLGINGVPAAGDILQVVASDKLARQIAMKRQMIQRERDLRKNQKITLDNLNSQIAEGAIKELKIIVKADVQGSAEVLKESLEGLSTPKVKLTCIHSAVGNISESDVLLAAASNAILFGFNVKPESGVPAAAQRESVDVRIYSVIYEIVEDVKAAMEGLLEPHYHEVHLGRAQVRTVFKLSSGVVAGCQVVSGKIQRGAHGKLWRSGAVLAQGKIETLRRFKDDVKEVSTGMECGITLGGFKEYEAGDEIECFQLETVAQKL